MTQSPPEFRLLYPRSSLSSASGDGLSNILVDELPDGALCVVLGTGLYKLDKFSSEVVASPIVLPTGRGAGALGRWIQFASGGSTVPTNGAFIVNPSDPAAYQTIQAAINAAVASGSDSLISIAPGPYAENLTIAGATASIELSALGDMPFGVEVTGTLSWTAGAVGSAKYLALTNLYVSGAVSASLAAGTAYLWINGGFYDSAITFTGAGKITLVAVCPALGPGVQNRAYFSDAITVTGGLYVAGFYLYGNLSAVDSLELFNCDSSAITITYTGGVVTDALTLSKLLSGGVTIAGGGSWANFDGIYLVPSMFPTIQAALNAGAAGSAAAYAVEIAPGTYTENITVAPGKSVELRGTGRFIYNTAINGTITWNGSAGGDLSLVNIEVYGAISGAATGHVHLNLLNAAIDSTITFTGSQVDVEADGSYGWGSAYQGYFVGTVSTTGRIYAANTAFYNSDLTNTTQPIRLQGCWLQDSITITTGQTEISIANCRLDAGTVPTFVFSGAAGIVSCDGYTLSQLLAADVATPTNGDLRNLNGGIQVRALNQTNNIAATDVIANPMTGSYRFDVVLIVKTVGTTGTIQPNVIFTDVLGTPTVAVGTGLNITGTGRVQGTYNLRAVGPGNIQFSVTGVVTPGTLNYDIEVTVTKL